MAIIRKTMDELRTYRLSPEKKARLDAMTPEEVEQNAIDDPDNPPSTDEEIARGVFGREVRRAREATGLTQEAFAQALGLAVGTLRNWEQGRFNPDPAARALIKLIAADPARALATLAA